MVIYQKFNSSVPFNFDVREYEDYSFVPNLHRDFELIYVKSGEITVNIENEEFTVSEGKIALVLQNEIHSFRTSGASRIWVAVFSEDFVRDFAEEIKLYRINSHLIEPSDIDADFLLKNLVFGDRDRLTLSACLSFACALFLKQCAEKGVSERKSNRQNELVHGILSYINEHYLENIHLEDIAASLGYESHYISRIFNRFFGKSFTSLVNEYRIYHARSLLRKDSSLTLSEVAFASGFGSLRNFNRAYLSVVGTSPRRKNKE